MIRHRITHHPILGTLEEKNEIHFYFNNIKLQALDGETIAAALLANGIRILRYHESSGSPRGIYCNIGHCFECRVKVDNNKKEVRACLTPVQAEMNINSGERLPNIFLKGNET